MKYCKEPFVHADIDTDGNIRLCCASWHDKIVGNINKNTLEQIWQSEEANEVRNSINDQTYKFCKLDICPLWQSDILSKKPYVLETKLPKVLKLSFDMSCNLQCPSCRPYKIQHLPGSVEYENSIKIFESIKRSYYELGKDQEALFIITGSGDPLGSDIFRNFLYDLDGYKLPKLKIGLLTNGVMLTEKIIKKLYKIHKNISYITISIDSANEETYNIIRKGGNFQQLRNNIDYLHSCEELKHVDVCYSFVVQDKNYKEMHDFIDWILPYNRATIRFTKILEWQNMGINFKQENVFDKHHPNYNDLQKTIAEIRKNSSDRINFTNLPAEFFER